jgi:hypothetical protein
MGHALEYFVVFAVVFSIVTVLGWWYRRRKQQWLRAAPQGHSFVDAVTKPAIHSISSISCPYT